MLDIWHGCSDGGFTGGVGEVGEGEVEGLEGGGVGVGSYENGGLGEGYF